MGHVVPGGPLTPRPQQISCDDISKLPDVTFHINGHAFTLPASAYVLNVSTHRGGDGDGTEMGVGMEMGMGMEVGMEVGVGVGWGWG